MRFAGVRGAVLSWLLIILFDFRDGPPIKMTTIRPAALGYT
jgi:hypothetical protein